MGAVAAGDEGALAELLDRYEHALAHFIHRHTGGVDVDDLYQETWLRVVRAAPRFDRSRRFSTWMFQIAVNLCRDWHRRTRPQQIPEGFEPAAGRQPSPDARVDASRLLARLPEAQREVVVLRYYHDFTEAQVAEILGCPKGTVKSRMHSAMAHLGRLVDDADVTAGEGGDDTLG